MKFLGVLKILILCPMLTHQRADSKSYIGAVAEYSPTRTPNNGKSAADLNAENYLKFIEVAKSYAVDIIVFPESSLSIATSKNKSMARSEAASYIPAPKDKIAPCDQQTYANSLRTISCAAREARMYVVINHQEKVDCSCGSCAADGYLIYNTNIVFDRSGVVVARYRKYNLFGEPGTNVTAEPEVSYFTTDFNVTFGQFICFDLLFQTPTLNLTNDLGITDFVFSAHWFSELPYLFAVQAQAAWSYANDVNFLAAGYNNPVTASGGSGIYIGRKGYTYSVTEKNVSNFMLISEVPKVVNGNRVKNIDPEMSHYYKFKNSEINSTQTQSTEEYVHKVDDLSAYTTELLSINIKSLSKSLCNRGFCCQFHIDIDFDQGKIRSGSEYYRYRLAVFNGARTFSGVATGGIKTCGIVSCVNETIEGCAQLFDPSVQIARPTVFNDILISTISSSDRNVFFMPVTLTEKMVPLNASEFIYQTSDNSIHDMKLTVPTYNLLTFAIYGRNFIADGLEEDFSARSYAPSIPKAWELFLVTALFFVMKVVNFSNILPALQHIT